MALGPKFYIYGGGRWREVDINNGRIEGWGPAKFVYSKRGKVAMAKTRSVLTALRDKAGRQSAVKDGARLPQKTESPQRNTERHSEKIKCDNSHHCPRSNHNGFPSKKTVKHSVAKVDASIQTTHPQTLTFPEPSRQKSDQKRSESTSSDDNEPIKITTTALVNSSPNKLSKLKLKKEWSLARPDKVSTKKVPSLKLHKENPTKYNLYRRKRTESGDSLIWVVLPKTKDNTKVTPRGGEYVETKSNQIKRRRKSTSSKSSQESRPQKIIRRTVSVAHIVSQTQNNIKKSKSSPNAIKNVQDKPTQKEIISSDDDLFISKHQSNSESIQNVDKANPSSQDKFKELIIGEEDVEVLRNYLLHNAPDFDLLKFDQSDEYKSQFFYTINPMVNVQRCPKIARMLHRDSQSEISLKDFASQLGLTSITEKKVPQRYKMRNRNADTDKSYETDAEYSKNMKNRVRHGRGDRSSRKIYATDTETDSDFEEVKRKSKSSNTRSQDRGDEAQTSSRYKKRHVGDRKEINHKTDVIEIFSSKKKPAKSDGNYSDGDSSAVEEVQTRDLRKRKTNSIQNIDLTSDSKRYKGANKRREHNKMNKTTKGSKVIKIDGKTSSDEDSDWVSETEAKRTQTRFSKRRNTDTDTNDESTEEESTNEDNKRDRNKNNKKNSSKQADNQIDSNKENENVTSKLSKSPNKRNKKGRFVKRKTTRKIDKKDSSDSSDDNSESGLTIKVFKRTRNKNNKKGSKTNKIDGKKSNDEDSDWVSETEVKRPQTRFSKRRNTDTDTNDESTEEESTNEVIKRDRNKNNKKNILKQADNQIDSRNEKEASDENSEAEDKSLKLKDSKRQNTKTNASKTNNKKRNLVDSTSENSGAELKYKEVKSKRQINELNDNTNIKAKNNVSQFDSNSEEEFESQKGSTKKPIKINTDTNNKNDRNNNMTDTNDENSEAEQRKKVTKAEQNKAKSNKIKRNKDSNKKQSNVQNKLNSKQNDTTETINYRRSASERINYRRSASETDVFAKTIIGEIKSLAVKPREQIKRPASSVSLQRVEYSNLEDHAIVSWLSMGGRGRCVNGNRIWLELQDQYQNIAGQHRTWHSLRNRYLRSILPRLGQLALNPSLVARLRAAAATGEIKSRKNSSRRNSIFGAPVPGALSRRPRAARSPSAGEEPPHKKRKSDHTRKPTSPPGRLLRSSYDSSPKKAHRSPRYSEITRHFAAKQRESTPNSARNSPQRKSHRNVSLDTKKSAKKSLGTESLTKNLSEIKNSTKNLSETRNSTKNLSETRNSTKNLSETKISSNKTHSNSERKLSKESATKLSSASKESSASKVSPTKSLRRSLREKSPQKGRTKTRKLFNPTSMI